MKKVLAAAVAVVGIAAIGIITIAGTLLVQAKKEWESFTGKKGGWF